MQEGDLADGPLPDILRLLAAAHATGGVHVRRRDERGESADAVLFLREGRLYAATAPGPRPLLGVRLVAAGAVTREALEEALESQAGELAGWRLGELLVHLGYVDGEIVAEFVVEQILDTVAEVSAWVAGGWRFRRGEKTREADGLSLDIEDVLERVAQRRQSWHDLEEYAGGATAVPERVPIDEVLAAQQIPLARAMLHEIDGVRTLAELATRCGLTTYEAGYVLAQLVEVGAVRLSAGAAPRQPAGADPMTPPVASIVAAVAASLPGAADLTGLADPSDPTDPTADLLRPDEIGFDAEDPLGLADLLGAVPVVDPAPVPEPPAGSAEDELAALLGGVAGEAGGSEDAGEPDLATQLAVLARQVQEARWAADSRRREEVRVRRAGTPVTPVPADEPAPGPVVPIGLMPRYDEPSAPPEEQVGPLATDPGDTNHTTDTTEIPVLPYEPIGLAPIETSGLSLAEPDRPETVPVLAEPAAPVADEPVGPDDAAGTDGPGVPRLPTRSAPAAPDPVVDEVAGALADLRGALDLAALAALDDPEPAGATWPAVDETGEPDQPGGADPDDGDLLRADLQSYLADEEPALDEVPHDAAPQGAGWPDASPAPAPAAWNPDEGHDFTPDEDGASTDTAALLRELSFLGLDDLPGPPPPPSSQRPPAPRQAPVPAGKGRRKSIFGR